MKATLAQHSPQLLKEIDYDKNSDFDPNSVGYSSAYKIWWKCEKGHSYYAAITSKTRKRKYGNGCPYCAGQKVLPGFNDLKTRYPDIAKEWDYIKNKIKPNKIMPGTRQKVWWICEKGHSYYTSVASRTNLKTGCPICANKKVLVGYNDLSTTNPSILRYWNYEKNKKLNFQPSDFTKVSGKKVWWICEKGHEWEAKISHITNGRRCPVCNCGRQTSFPEQAIFYYISQVDETCINRYKIDGRNELDIYLPKYNIGIEYDGYRWHDAMEKQVNDHFKTDFWKKQGVRIIRIKEQDKGDSQITAGDVIDLNGNEWYLNEEDYVALSDLIRTLIKEIYNKDADVDVDRDCSKIYSNYLLKETENSMAKNLKILKFYDYEKNKNINPEYITRSSGKKVWWKCENGHSFQATVHSMEQGLICLECKKELFRKNGLISIDDNYIKTLKYSADIKSLLYEYPELSKEWDYEKNYPLRPENVISKSNKKVWWKCKKCSHEWQAPPANRIKGIGCKKCAYKNISVINSKKVLQYSTEGILLKEYNSVTDAVKDTGIKHISAVCRGERATAGGYIWKYK
jgi:hypothetical protein